MINNPRIDKILYGGDYNPEQWPSELMVEDMRLLEYAHMDVVTLNVFNWAMLQPGEDEYDFTKLDEEITFLTKHQKKICLATSTAAHPAWMARQYPEILRVDFEGRKRKFGGRHNACPNSPIYRKYSRVLASKLAERYQDNPSIVAWHISNEYGGRCYCERCEQAFRVWLQSRYGTLDKLNKVWNTSFWGHTFYDWEEIVAPNILSEHFEYDRTMFQGISLDYARFSSDSLLSCYQEEVDVIRAITPHIPVTTNLMGFYKELDYQKWAKHMDFISWDNYPAHDDPSSKVAMSHDLMRGLKGGLPFILMEQTPSVTNWAPYNALKRPGVMRLWSYQAVAHGSDSVMFFQIRRSIGACEKYHGALIDHVGTEHTRVFRECQALGKELEALGDAIIGSRISSKVAIVFDWDNWWALEYSAGPSCELRYVDEVLKYYEACHRLNIPVDFVGVEDALEGYDLVVAPVLYMVKSGYDQVLKAYVAQGGHLVTSFFSGIVDEHDLVMPGGYPGNLRELLGIWVEEQDALPQGKENKICWEEEIFPARLICDLIHCEGAEALATYGEDFYQKMPAMTENHYGKGRAWYIATSSDETFYKRLMAYIAHVIGIKQILDTPEGVEVTRREKNGKAYTFILNHTEKETEIILSQGGRELLKDKMYNPGCVCIIESKDVMIIEN